MELQGALLQACTLVDMAPVEIPAHELRFTFARSAGAGGQNVNKVNSKAQLRWNPGQSAAFSALERERLQKNLAHRLTVEGDLLVTSERHRDQLRNREDCLVKLGKMIAEALHVPKCRKKTRPTRASKRRGAEAKARHSEKKRLRHL